jgi:hypothetical protein
MVGNYSKSKVSLCPWYIDMYIHINSTLMQSRKSNVPPTPPHHRDHELDETVDDACLCTPVQPTEFFPDRAVLNEGHVSLIMPS